MYKRPFSSQVNKVNPLSSSINKPKPPSPTQHSKFGSYDLITPTFLQRLSIEGKQNRSTLLMPSRENCPPWAYDPTWIANTRFGRDLPDLIDTPDDQDKLRAAGRLAKAILKHAGTLVKEGVTTLEINDQVHSEIVRRGAYPSPLGYRGFPKSICTSINNVMAHGIPDMRPLKSGDIINIDITVYRSGFHGDCSATFIVGQVDEQASLLIQATRLALDNAIKKCEPNALFTVIPDAIMKVAREYRFKVSPDMCGHGIGRQFHSAPIVHHVRRARSSYRANRHPRMVPGMSFTIEPIFCQGSPEYILHPDNWTAVSVDGGRSAQFEETLLVTENQVEIITADC